MAAAASLAGLDPRIGYLNSGRFYAYVGAERTEVMGTRAQVEAALGLTPSAAAAAAPVEATVEAPGAPVRRAEGSQGVRDYEVSVTPGVESWNVKAYTVIVAARNRDAAIREAREAYNESAGWTNGAATYRARLVREH